MEDEFKPTILGDLRRIQKTIAQDFTGDAARTLLSDLDAEAARQARRLRAAAAEDEPLREHLSQYIEGCRASQRIVRQAWEQMHSAALLS